MEREEWWPKQQAALFTPTHRPHHKLRNSTHNHPTTNCAAALTQPPLPLPWHKVVRCFDPCSPAVLLLISVVSAGVLVCVVVVIGVVAGRLMHPRLGLSLKAAVFFGATWGLHSKVFEVAVFRTLALVGLVEAHYTGIHVL
jgi:hypothetical protein